MDVAHSDSYTIVDSLVDLQLNGAHSLSASNSFFGFYLRTFVVRSMCRLGILKGTVTGCRGTCSVLISFFSFQPLEFQ